MNDWGKYLRGSDLRSIANVNRLVPLIKSQHDFDKLFQYLLVNDRLLNMRAADAIEKITKKNANFLIIYKEKLLELFNNAKDKELKWHMSLLVSRLELSANELTQVWHKLTDWINDKSESKIVRVNSLQSLHDLTIKHKALKRDFFFIIQKLELENIPSINARIKKLKKKIHRI